MKRWYLFLANAFVLLYMQVRAGWLSVVVAALIWAVLTRQVRVLTRVASAALAALIFLAILDVKIPGSPDRGGQVSITGILARTVAPFDERLAAKYSTDSEGFKDTAAWRQIWWDFIWTEVHGTPIRTVYGLGYGRPLSYLAENIPEAEKPIRAPHNVFFFALGYEGWLGVLLAGLFQAGLFRLAWVVWKQRREPFPLMLAAMGLCMGLFDNFYETPFAAVPMYFLLGVALAPAAPELVRAAQTATRRSGCP